MNRVFVATVVASSWAVSAFAGLSVAEDKDGRLSVLRDGKVLVESIDDVFGKPAPQKIQKAYVVASDGAKVWNRWSEEKIGRYRLEVVERPDGTIEMTVLGEADGSTPNRVRGIRLAIPAAALDGKPWRALTGNGRAEKPGDGVFKKGMERFDARWMACDGLVWDFNPQGPGGYDHSASGNSLSGVWKILPVQHGRYHFHGASSFGRSVGGFGGTKLVLREGTFEDYDKYHFFRTFRYAQRFLPSRLVALGAPKFGTDYVAGDFAFDADRGFGWAGDVARKMAVGHPSGAYYSHVCGKGTAVYRFAGLPNGWYVMTFQLGNYTGTPNRFAISVNGETIAKDISVVKGKARTLTRGVHVAGGTADVTFAGDWLVSAIGLQPLLSDAEDFGIRRAVWYVDGYEPSVMFRSANLKEPLKPALADETIDMPIPGQETAAPRCDPPVPVELPDPDTPSLKWLEDARVWNVGRNTGSMAEYADLAWMEKYVAEQSAGKNYSAAMVSGMLSRHTYPTRIDEGLRIVRGIVPIFHRHGIKYIDHIDLTLLWNIDRGFRVLMERMPEVLRDKYDNLSGVQLCMNNPEMKRKIFEYLRKDVEAGVDGFQLDEGEFWRHGCACQVCREKFTKETGWQFPLDETDPSVTGLDTPLAKRWHQWRSKTITNWYVELRRYLKDLKPDLVLSMYTTHWGFSSSHPSRGASSDLIDLGRVINYFGTEVMTRNAMQSARSLLPLRKMKHILRIGYGAPVWGCYYNGSQEGNYFTWAAANMSGESAYLSDLPLNPLVPRFQKWGASAANMTKQATSVCEVGVLFSGYSRDWNRTVGFVPDALGLAQELEAMHVPYEFIGDMSVTERQLAKYKVFFVGTAQCLDDTEIAAIKAFTAKGGRVYVTETAGTRDEIGEPRQDPAFAAALRDPKSNIALMPSAAPFAAKETSPGQVWKFDPDPKAEAEFRAKLAEMVKGATVWETRGLPDRVYTTLWRETNGDLIVHFLNATGANIKPGETMTPKPPDPAYPGLSEDIAFRIPATGVRDVTASSPDFYGVRKLEFSTREEGFVSVCLPKELLKAYTMVRIVL